MEAYETLFTYFIGAFPATRGINTSGPLTQDGTEYKKAFIDGLWSRYQAQLSFYGAAPNGLPDDNGTTSGIPNSQELALNYFNYGCPGMGVVWWPNFDPATLSLALGFDIRILLLNGQGIDRTLPEYLLLDLLNYVGDPDNATADSFYHADDAGGTSRNTAGQFLILPEMDGRFLRGLDPSGTIDPDGASRILGSYQDDAGQQISGDFEIRVTDNLQSSVVADFNGAFSLGNQTGVSSNDSFGGSPTNRIYDTISFDSADSPGARTSNETRSKNVACRFGIYY